ncbi:ATP-binding protein [Cupriavidus sp. L7L]|uniref:ATP-binding protein n=1 Tax=Cupriavidus sp. L7L TaxID=2546443 RepID=UPI001055E1F1|nr:ATP-binding protein [Cupriavidus sp. L7L]TDF59515.1 ATP-binding protein [Cupriavidus sp. L7L]
MTPSDSKDEIEHERLAQVARSRIALLGAFDPRALFGSILGSDSTDLETMRAVLRKLASDCAEIPDGEGFKWRMNPDARRMTLAQLRASGQLSEAAHLAAPEPSDAFGTYLVASILGQPVDLNRLSTEALDDFYTAVQFTAPLLSQAPSPDEIEMVLARRELVTALDIALPTRLFGRATELKRLERYAHRIQGQQDEPAPQRPMRLTGIGGSGKSALLAAFTRKQINQGWGMLPIVWLDFDRAALASADVNVLLPEFSRQLALHCPELSGRLKRFRHSLRETFTEFQEVSSTPNFEAAATFDSQIWSIWRSALGDALPIRRPVVLILDTFEEILLRGTSEMGYIYRWLQSLNEEGQLYGIRTILSGRAVSDEVDPTAADPNTDDIVLQDIPASQATRYLQRLLVDAGRDPASFPCRALVARYGGNPLLIKILARYLVESFDPSNATQLLQGGQDELDQRFSQGFLYRRLLKRLRSNDAELESVAQLGLVLRVVTPAVIEHVLSAPCQLPGMSAARAMTLFNELARHVWLVERTGTEFVVRHRRDLRRVMMKLMSPTEKDAAAQVHEGAVSYYRALRDPYLDRTQQAQEAQYHSLFTSSPYYPSASEARSFLHMLGEDVQVVPIAIRAKLKFLANRGLVQEEVESLSDNDRIAYDSGQVRRAVGRGDASLGSAAVGRAKIWGELHAVLPSPEIVAAGQVGVRGGGGHVDIESYVAAEFSRADVQTLAGALPTALDYFFSSLNGEPWAWRSHADSSLTLDSVSSLSNSMGEANTNGALQRGQRSPIEGDLTESFVWRVAMAAIAVHEQDKIDELVATVQVNWQAIDWDQPLNRASKFTISADMGVSLLFSLLSCAPEGWRRTAPKHRSMPRQVSTIEQLRGLQLAISDLETLPQAISPGLLCDLSPEFERYIDLKTGDKSFGSSVSSTHSLSSRLGMSSNERVSLAMLQRSRAEMAFIVRISGRVISDFGGT